GTAVETGTAVEPGTAVETGTAGVRSPGPWSEIVRQLLEIPEEQRRAVLFSHVRREVASVIGLQSPDLLAPDQGLFDLGLDSLMAVDLARRLERALGRELPTTLAIDHPTVDALTDRLLDLGTSLDLFGSGRGWRASSTTFADEPIAIIGMGCRFPGGADSPQRFWDLLRAGTDAVVDVPPSRWEASEFYDPDPDVPLKMYTSKGGFLSGPVDEFDAETFGIAPREAMAMDPQQRLLLEVAWEALEDAGVPVSGLVGSSTGVYVGINTGDYMQLLSTSGLPDVDAYLATGNTFSVAAGRLSYLFGLHGPSMAIDTACSSSLVAADLACQDLHRGGVDLAIIGGVNLMLSPTTSISLAKMRALAPDGRCKAFDAAADGYGRGEGCGVVVLKRLSDAVADGDRIWATIRGAAVNQDGRSAGLTVPNGPAQQALIRDALSSGGIVPSMVDYVEAHGTGTPLGDPVELQALASVLGDGRDEGRPLLVGSVKTNIGHLEAAAGIAGLIKLALAIHHGEVPPHLHLSQPNPYVDWDHLPVTVPTVLAEWPAHEGPRIGAVSSFGFSGTNAHIVLGSAPSGSVGSASPQEEKDGDRPQLLLLSARSVEARAGLAAKYQEALVGTAGPITGGQLASICEASATSRSHHDYRLALVAKSAEEAAARISEWQEGGHALGLQTGRVPGRAPRLLFVFSGQGAQWPKMGVDLLDEPAFRSTFMACDEIVREHAGWSPLEELLADEGRSRLEDTEIAQPVVFSVQAGLVELWKSWSVRPDAVTGHSVGEIGAAFTAGALSLDDAVRIVVERGRLMQPAKGRGRMAVLGLPAPDVEKLLADLDGPNLDGPNLDGPNLDRPDLDGPDLAGQFPSPHSTGRVQLSWRARPCISTRCSRRCAPGNISAASSPVFMLFTAPIWGPLQALWSTA
ncbi:MAG TPA: beta-ketoacyl synthase N-terminal-like domain-containing protein, partial [Acidimicrobiales bacterium]|nr:beta-ketoacyl synthase N-terminal-like domain-containing protein [Acidimicrobiales bacterium]